VTNAKDKNFLLYPAISNMAVREFLVRNPFICRDGEGLKAAVFVEGDRSLSSGDIARLYREHSVRGLQGVIIYILGDNLENIEVVVPPSLAGSVFIRSVHGSVSC